LGENISKNGSFGRKYCPFAKLMVFLGENISKKREFGGKYCQPSVRKLI